MDNLGSLHQSYHPCSWIHQSQFGARLFLQGSFPAATQNPDEYRSRYPQHEIYYMRDLAGERERTSMDRDNGLDSLRLYAAK